MPLPGRLTERVIMKFVSIWVALSVLLGWLDFLSCLLETAVRRLLIEGNRSSNKSAGELSALGNRMTTATLSSLSLNGQVTGFVVALEVDVFSMNRSGHRPTGSDWAAPDSPAGVDGQAVVSFQQWLDSLGNSRLAGFELSSDFRAISLLLTGACLAICRQISDGCR
jgi:hypothetical protein